MIKKLVVSLLSGLVLSATAGISVMATEESDPNKEQFFPVMSYWSGPFAPGGSGIAGGWMDYMALLNIRDGGVNGVKLTWEKCDFGYVTERAVECYERLKGKG